MIKFSFENSFGFEKSLAVVWRMLEMEANTYIGGKLPKARERVTQNIKGNSVPRPPGTGIVPALY